MHIRILLACFGLAILTGCNHTTPVYEWVPVSLSDGGASFSMPGKPYAVSEAGFQGYKYEDKPVAGYSLGYADIPEASTVDPVKFLDSVSAKYIASFNGQVDREERTTANGYPALDIDLTAQDGTHLFTRYCIVSQRYYILRTAFIKAARKPGINEQTKRFFNSFKPVAIK